MHRPSEATGRDPSWGSSGNLANLGRKPRARLRIALQDRTALRGKDLVFVNRGADSRDIAVLREGTLGR